MYEIQFHNIKYFYLIGFILIDINRRLKYFNIFYICKTHLKFQSRKFEAFKLSNDFGHPQSYLSITTQRLVWFSSGLSNLEDTACY